jgi:hypothetical protein
MVEHYRQKEREYLDELKKARIIALAHLEEIDRKIAALTGDYNIGRDNSGSNAGGRGYNMSPLGKRVIILAANVRGLKQRVAKGEAHKSELVAAERELKDLKGRAVAERKRTRNASLRDARRFLAQKKRTEHEVLPVMEQPTGRKFRK